MTSDNYFDEKEILEGSFYLLAFTDQRVVEDSLTKVRVVILDEKGLPVKNAEVNIFSSLSRTIDNDLEDFLLTKGKTNKDGCYIAKIPKLALEKTHTKNIEVVAKIIDNNYIYQKKKVLKFDQPIRKERLEICCTTDRKAYLPGQSILIHLIAWKQSNDYQPLQNESIIVTFASDQLSTIFAKELTTDELGVTSLEIPTCNDLPEGPYRIGIHYNDDAAFEEIELKRYEKPTISLEEEITFSPLTIHLSAEYAWGKPVDNAKVAVKLLYQGKVIFSQEELAFIEGKLSLKINEKEAPFSSKKNGIKNEDYLTLHVQLEDSVGRSQNLIKSFKYYQKAANLTLLTLKQIYHLEEQIPITIQLQDPKGKGLDGKGQLHFLNVEENFVINNGICELVINWWKDFPKNPEQLKGLLLERLSVVIDGDFGKIESEKLIFIDPSHSEKSWEINLQLDKEEYQVGDTAKITLSMEPLELLQNQSKIPVYLDFNRQSLLTTTNGYLSKKGKYKTTLTFTEYDWGTCEIRAYVFLEGKILEQTKMVTIIPDKRLDIQMSFEKDCKPGQEIILKAKTNSPFKEPVSFLAMLVDESSLAIAPYQPDPFRSLYQKQWAINKEVCYLATPGKIKERLGQEEIKEIVEQIMGDFKGYPRYQSIMTDVDHYTREYYGPSLSGRGGKKRNGNGEENGENGEEPIVSVRFLFPETAFWSPVNISTDGKIELPIKLPHTISKFRMSTLALSSDMRVGINHDSLAITQDFFVSDNLPQIMTVGDTMNIAIILNNDSAKKLTASINISSEKPISTRPSDEEELEGIVIEPNGAKKTNWSIEALELGHPEIVIEGKTDKFIDVVKKKIKVQPATEPEILSYVSKIKDTHEFLIELEEEVSHSESELEIYSGYSSSHFFQARAYEQLGFCVDQTADFLLTNLASYKYMKKRLVHLQNEASIAASREILEKIDKMIVLGIQKLLAASNNKGWGWYKTAEPSLTFSAKVMRALLQAWEQGFHVPEWVLSNFYFFEEKRAPEGYWEGKKSNIETTALVCSVLAMLWKEDPKYEGILPIIDVAISYLSDRKDEIKEDPYLTAVTILACLEAKKLRTNPFVADLIQAIINQQQKEDDSIFWTSSVMNKEKIEVTALALQALLKAGGAIYRELIQKGINWLMKEKGWREWRTDRARAEVLTLLAELEEKEISEGTIKITINKQELEKVKITKDNKETILQSLQNIPLQLKKGLNKIKLTWEGDSELFGKIVIKQWFKDPRRKINDLLIHRSYNKEELLVGELLQIQYKVQFDRPRERLIIRENIPPGFRVEEGSIPVLPELKSYEIHQNYILFFLEGVKKTIMFNFKMLAQQAGIITHRPALIYQLADPSDNCLSKPTKIIIKLK
ncbi:MAG: hypothetical protein GF308_07130 [Candidatus Heimdallarchaeota archaeon]|nr:hypothetical protein [Candidatus Heimdallarchaeota archaeon]